MTDLLTPARPQHVPRAEVARLPWHLRKRFLLPVVMVLLAGAVSSMALLAGAIYTYVRVQQAVSELQADLGQLGLPLGQQDDAAAAPAVLPESAPVSGVGDAGEAGRVTYVLEGDLDDVEATWTVDSAGTTRSEDVYGERKAYSYVVDGSWPTVGISAERTSGRGAITCSVLGEGDVVLDTMTDQGSGASVVCSL